MKIVSADFVVSAHQPADFPRAKLPQIAFVGRSNVGKSSVINCLLQRKGLAKTSSSPGKTRGINFYRINNRYFFVDLPGYGFAKVSQQQRLNWRRLIEQYLANNSFLIGAVQILDSRLELTDNDLVMLRWLRHYQIPMIIIATKADKLSQNQLVSQLERLNRALSVQGFPEAIPFSAKTELGQHQLWKAIQRLLKSEDNREKS